MSEFVDTCKVIGSVWNRRQGWTCPAFPDVPKKTVALSVYSHIPGCNAWDTEDKLIELGFNPSYRHLGLNTAQPKDPTTCVFFIRKYLCGDSAIDCDIQRLIDGGLPYSAVLVVSHRVYCSIMQRDRD